MWMFVCVCVDPPLDTLRRHVLPMGIVNYISLFNFICILRAYYIGPQRVKQNKNKVYK